MSSRVPLQKSARSPLPFVFPQKMSRWFSNLLTANFVTFTFFTFVLANSNNLIMDLLGIGTADPNEPFWMEKIKHQGISPFNSNATEYKVFRNVKVSSLPSRISRLFYLLFNNLSGLRRSWWWGSWWYCCHQVILALDYTFSHSWLMLCVVWRYVIKIDVEEALVVHQRMFLRKRQLSQKPHPRHSQCFSCRRIFSERACLTSITRLISHLRNEFLPGLTSFLHQSLLTITPSWSVMQRRLQPYWRPPRLMVWQWLVRLHTFITSTLTSTNTCSHRCRSIYPGRRRCSILRCHQ